MSNKTSAIGYMADNRNYSFTSLLEGNGWLIRDGESYLMKNRDFAPHHNSSFMHLKAPRTAMGLLGDGSLFLAVVDGVEVWKTGLDLWEFTEILLEQGAVQAINLDGGGSTDAVLNGEVWSRPSCDDLGPVCERPVTTITCIRYQDNASPLFLAF